MKAILCGECHDIRGLPQDRSWIACRCGNMEAHWVDPQRGTVEVRARTRSRAFMLGLNNHMLVPALRGETGMWKDARRLHDAATDAPGYVFDKSRAGCWAVVFRVGTTNDVSWVSDDEPEPLP